jgi:hypothetical protein
MGEAEMKTNGKSSSGGRSLLIMMILVPLVIVAGATAWLVWKGYGDSAEPGALAEVEWKENVQNQYDVIVVGTDPEGVAAAVSSARNGLKTLLVDGRNRQIIGGLMTLGWLNSLDHNYSPDRRIIPGQPPKLLNAGIFEEWYKKTEGDSFDVVTAANAFRELVMAEPLIDLHLMAKDIQPIVKTINPDSVLVEGITLTKANGQVQQIHAKAVIDATQDGDIAAASGVPYTYGREDLGDKNAKMAVTLVFRLKNVTEDVWSQVIKRLEGDNDPNTGANARSAWGYVEMQKYPAVNKERLRMRGLNIGRQNDDTMLINALQIFGVDPLNPKSLEEAFQIAKEELPHVLAHMKELYPEFAALELDATAPELYVRESRHMMGEYRLTMVDVLDNRDHWDRIAYGSYPVDIQRISPTDNGAVMSEPLQYGIPFRSIVPLKADGLLVVGRAASFESLPHGSARVIPVGMATAQAAGAAAKLAIDGKMTFRDMAESKEDIARLQETLTAQGMDLKPYKGEPPYYAKHKSYSGLKAAVSMALITGGYGNKGFALDDPSNAKRMVNHLLGIRKVHASFFSGDPNNAIAGMKEPEKEALTLEQAAYTMIRAVGLTIAKDQSIDELERRNWLTRETIDSIADPSKLTNGDAFMMIKDLIAGLVGIKYE